MRRTARGGDAMTGSNRSGVLAVLIAVACLMVSVAAASPAGAASNPWLTRMAGYVWPGAVKSVQASWGVPQILSRNGAAHASTWVGAQVLGDSAHSPFIQVGTTEDRQPSLFGSPDQYWTFWSDVALGFHPHLLFAVHPGDKVTSSLSLSGGRWHVSVSDTTSGQ